MKILQRVISYDKLWVRSVSSIVHLQFINFESNRDKGIVTRNRTGKCEGRKRILEIHHELESLILKLRKKGLSLRKISSLLKEEYGYEVSFMSVSNILKDTDWMRKERRRMKRLETVN